MEKFDPEQKQNRPDHLPQSEAEWLETGEFNVETIEIGGKKIRCALVKGTERKPLITMAGGIPRDPLWREKLPIINKFYGYLALKLKGEGESSILYNQPATGGSGGEWGKETIQSRADVLSGISTYFRKRVHSSDLSLVGTSAGAYIAVNALEQLENQNIKIPKLALISPAAYPKEAEDVPYGETFSNIIRKPWNVADSPIFPKLEKYVKNGGSLFLGFFEHDDPPIPKHIQEYFRMFAERLSDEGGIVHAITIPGVAHNFRKVDATEDENIVDDSIRTTAQLLAEFLK